MKKIINSAISLVILGALFITAFDIHIETNYYDGFTTKHLVVSDKAIHSWF